MLSPRGSVRHDASQLVHVPTHHSHCFSTCSLRSCVCAPSHPCLVTNSCDHLMAQVTLKKDTCCKHVRSTFLSVFQSVTKWTQACDRRLARFISTFISRVITANHCYVGNAAQHLSIGSYFKIQILQNQKSHHWMLVCAWMVYLRSICGIWSL